MIRNEFEFHFEKTKIDQPIYEYFYYNCEKYLDIF